jgi:hypothetical protein
VYLEDYQVWVRLSFLYQDIIGSEPYTRYAWYKFDDTFKPSLYQFVNHYHNFKITLETAMGTDRRRMGYGERFADMCEKHGIEYNYRKDICT